ncbi:MAG: NAD(P)/FAD-dependent oxidoreductase [Ornithinimicrobium sp.]
MTGLARQAGNDAHHDERVRDLVVVGGGPVGLATAIHARMAGLRVVVLEPRAGTIDKACGEGLMPGALASLARVGVDPAGMPMRGITYTDGTRSASTDFAVGPGRGVRRTELHRSLRERADETGVQVMSSRMASLHQDSAGVDIMLRGTTKHVVRSRYVVGADGLHSRARREVGAGRPSTHRRRYGFRQHYAMAPWTDHVEVHWGRDAEVYVTPISPDSLGVAVLTSRTGSFEEHIAQFPAVARRVDAASPISSVRAAGPLRQQVRHRRHGRVLLVGDAGGYVDALTGEGLSVGLAQAEVAVQAIRADAPGQYEAMARSVSWRSTLLTTALVEATRVPMVRRAIVPAAQRAPWLFSRAVNELAATAPP